MEYKTASAAGSHLVDQAAQSAEQAIASTRRMANEAMDDLTGSVEGLRGAAAPALGRLAEHAGALAQSGVDAVREGTHQLADKARNAGDGTVRYIQHEPVKAMLMAAATGAALMALVNLVAARRHGRD